MSADFEGNDKDAVVTQQVLDVIDSYGFKKEGAYNLRLNGLAVCHGDSRHIKIVPKEDRQGIDIYISGEAKEEQVHIPVVMTEEGVDIVYNDFLYISHSHFYLHEMHGFRHDGFPNTLPRGFRILR